MVTSRVGVRHSLRRRVAPASAEVAHSSKRLRKRSSRRSRNGARRIALAARIESRRCRGAHRALTIARSDDATRRQAQRDAEGSDATRRPARPSKKICDDALRVIRAPRALRATSMNRDQHTR
jgi:hypothetical protein